MSSSSGWWQCWAIRSPLSLSLLTRRSFFASDFGEALPFGAHVRTLGPRGAQANPLLGSVRSVQFGSPSRPEVERVVGRSRRARKVRVERGRTDAGFQTSAASADDVLVHLKRFKKAMEGWGWQATQTQDVHKCEKRTEAFHTTGEMVTLVWH